MNPWRYSWQPNHGDRSNLYTKKPRQPPKFGSPKSYPPGLARAVALQRQKAFRILAAADNSTAPKSTNSVDGSFPPIIPHQITKPFYPSQDTGPPTLAEVNITDLARESTRRFAELRALSERSSHQQAFSRGLSSIPDQKRSPEHQIFSEMKSSLKLVFVLELFEGVVGYEYIHSSFPVGKHSPELPYLLWNEVFYEVFSEMSSNCSTGLQLSGLKFF